jgi:dethiobiotin synthetase
MAAAALGLPAFTIAGLVEELRWPSPEPDVRWIESVGGVRSPLADDGDTVDLCRWLEPDVAVLVADAGLGAINAVLLSVAALRPHPVWVLLNRFDPAVDVHRRNAQWLRERGGLDVIWDPIQLADRCVSRLAG